MSYKKRMIPPVALTMHEGFFNLLMETLTINENLNLEYERQAATQLKEKLLNYAVPKLDDKGQNIVEIRFFEREASSMIWQLLINCLHLESKNDYYSQLKKLNNEEN